MNSVTYRRPDGRVFVLPPLVVERARRKYERGASDECWPWQGRRTTGKNRGVYRLKHGRRATDLVAHRLVLAIERGTCPPVRLRHTCGNAACVNPDHLAVASTTIGDPQCVNGHELDEQTTRVDADGTRFCRACAREASRRHFDRTNHRKDRS